MMHRSSGLIVNVFLILHWMCYLSIEVQAGEIVDCMAEFDPNDKKSNAEVHSTMSLEEQAKAIANIKQAHKSCRQEAETEGERCSIARLMTKEWDKDSWTVTYGRGPYIHYSTLSAPILANEHFMASCSSPKSDDYHSTVIISRSEKWLLASSATITTSEKSSPALYTDCVDWHRLGRAMTSGIYRLSPVNIAPFDAYCDMTTDGGGWTVIQRRLDDTLTFWNQTWEAYQQGFNNGLHQNLWLGNERIHMLTAKDPEIILRVDLWGDRAPEAKVKHANGYWYDNYYFAVGDAASKYELTVSLKGGGNATDTAGLAYNNGSKFSTVDAIATSGNADCVNNYQLGGWWLPSNCAYVSLNGKYVPNSWQGNYGFEWYLPDHTYINPVRSEMKIRRSR